MTFILSLPIIAAVLLFLALLSFMLSAAETSIIGLSKIRLRHMVSQGVKHAQSIQRLAAKMDRFITAILIGNNFLNVAISTLVTVVFVQMFGYNWGVVLSTLATTFFILVFCEITPKILATKRTEKIALLSSPFMEALIKALEPFIQFFINISSFTLKLLKIDAAKRSPLITQEELRMMIEIGREEGVLSDEEKKMLYRIFEFGDTKVAAVMVPKDKIVAININATSEEVLNTLVEQGHERIPVFEKSIDNIIGIIYARDLLYILRDKKLFVLQDLLHQPYYVGSSVKVSEVLKKFQADKVQIAVVVDDNKRAVGIVTLEDLLEEIVGEIEEDRRNHKK